MLHAIFRPLYIFHAPATQSNGKLLGTFFSYMYFQTSSTMLTKYINYAKKSRQKHQP